MIYGNNGNLDYLLFETVRSFLVVNGTSVFLILKCSAEFFFGIRTDFRVVDLKMTKENSNLICFYLFSWFSPCKSTNFYWNLHKAKRYWRNVSNLEFSFIIQLYVNKFVKSISRDLVLRWEERGDQSIGKEQNLKKIPNFI